MPCTAQTSHAACDVHPSGLTCRNGHEEAPREPRGPLAALRNQSLDQSRDQLVGNRLRQEELGGALTVQMGSKLRLELLVELWNRVEADVLLPAC